MEKSWKGDQLWSLAAASLRNACGNEALAEIWKESLLQLCTEPKVKKKLECSSSSDVARLLLHSLGRGHALIKQAIDWENPRIGREGSKSRLDATRGIMWRYAMAYCGWDRCTNSLGITQSIQEELLSETDYHLKSPNLTDSQRKQILAWIPLQNVDDDYSESCINTKWINEFLGVRVSYQHFPDWLIGEKTMKQAALLAVLRNIVCHGSLLPTKARSWGLEKVYREGIDLISTGFYSLTLSLLPQTTSSER